MSVGVAFWCVMTFAAMFWYCTVTVYVAFKGAYDIKHMLQKLAKDQDDEEFETQEDQ